MISRRWRGRQRQEVACRRSACASAVTVAVGGSRPITASIATDLPEPDSPTIASTSPASTESRRRRRRGTRRPRCRTRPRGCGSRGAPSAQLRFSFGSSASRRPSPIRLMASTVIRMARPGNVTTHQALQDELARLGEHGAPFRRRRLRAHAEEAERGGVEDGVGEGERRLHDQRRRGSSAGWSRASAAGARRRRPWRRSTYSRFFSAITAARVSRAKCGCSTRRWRAWR